MLANWARNAIKGIQPNTAACEKAPEKTVFRVNKDRADPALAALFTSINDFFNNIPTYTDANKAWLAQGKTMRKNFSVTFSSVGFILGTIVRKEVAEAQQAGTLSPELAHKVLSAMGAKQDISNLDKALYRVYFQGTKTNRKEVVREICLENCPKGDSSEANQFIADIFSKHFDEAYSFSQKLQKVLDDNGVFDDLAAGRKFKYTQRIFSSPEELKEFGNYLYAFFSYQEPASERPDTYRRKIAAASIDAIPIIIGRLEEHEGRWWKLKETMPIAATKAPPIKFDVKSTPDVLNGVDTSSEEAPEVTSVVSPSSETEPSTKTLKPLRLNPAAEAELRALKKLAAGENGKAAAAKTLLNAITKVRELTDSTLDKDGRELGTTLLSPANIARATMALELTAELTQNNPGFPITEQGNKIHRKQAERCAANGNAIHTLSPFLQDKSAALLAVALFGKDEEAKQYVTQYIRTEQPDDSERVVFAQSLLAKTKENPARVIHVPTKKYPALNGVHKSYEAGENGVAQAPDISPVQEELPLAALHGPPFAPLREEEQVTLAVDASVLRGLVTPRCEGDAKKGTWLDLLELTSQFPNVKIVIPSVVADWEMVHRLATIQPDGETVYEPIEALRKILHNDAQVKVEQFEDFFDKASRAKLDAAGHIQLTPSERPDANPNIIIWETAGDQALYQRIRDIAHSALPPSKQRDRIRDEINHHGEGEKAIERFLQETPLASPVYILSNDNQYFKTRNHEASFTPLGQPVGEANLQTYLRAEIAARGPVLNESLQAPLDVDTVIQSINRESTRCYPYNPHQFHHQRGTYADAALREHGPMPESLKQVFERGASILRHQDDPSQPVIKAPTANLFSVTTLNHHTSPASINHNHN